MGLQQREAALGRLPGQVWLYIENLSTSPPFFYTGLGISLSGSLFATGAVESISNDITALRPQQLDLTWRWFMIPITIEPTLITMATYDSTVLDVPESISNSIMYFMLPVLPRPFG